MKPSEQAFELIKRFEQFRAKAYKATKDEKYFTIGYGHCSKDIKQRDIVTISQAEELLRHDVGLFAEKLDERCPYLTQRQFDALTSLIYNIGWYNFAYSMTGNLCAQIGTRYTPEQCAARIILWVKQGSKTLLGLQIRRCEEANYFLGVEKYRCQGGIIVEL